MCKEIRKVMKDLKKLALPNSFKVVQSRHIKIYLSMLNDEGETKNLRFILGMSPSDTNWVKQFTRQKRRYLAQNNISVG